MQEKEKGTKDFLALERTKLANERTFLAYFRTFIVTMSSGFAIIKIEALGNLKELGYFFVGIALFFMVVGTVRFLFVRNRIRKTYYS